MQFARQSAPVDGDPVVNLSRIQCFVLGPSTALAVGMVVEANIFIGIAVVVFLVVVAATSRRRK